MRPYWWVSVIAGFGGGAMMFVLIHPDGVTPRWVVGQCIGLVVLVAFLSAVHFLMARRP
jgi:hypothetical protein